MYSLLSTCLKNKAEHCFGSIKTFLNTSLLKLHPPTSFKTFHLKLELWRALHPVTFDCVFLRSNLPANFQSSCNIFLSHDHIFENRRRCQTNTQQWRVRGKVKRRWATEKVMYWIWASYTKGACACWAAEMCIDGAGSWPCAWPPLMDELRWCLAKYCCLNIYTQADGQRDSLT